MANKHIINFEGMTDVQFTAHCKWIAKVIASEKTATSYLLAEAAKRLDKHTQVGAE